VLGDAAVLVFAPDHEARDVLQEQQGDAALVAQLDEVRPFIADSANRTPLLATMPTGCPWMCAKPVTRVSPYSRLNSSNRLPSTRRTMISRASYGVVSSTGTTS
jgi:hypothetical protein